MQQYCESNALEFVEFRCVPRDG